QQPGIRLHGRTVKHEIAVTLGKERDDLLVAASGGNLFGDLLAQVAGEIGIGIGDGLVLADQAAQLVDQRLVTRLLGGIIELLVGGVRGERQHDQQQQQHSHCSPSSARSASMAGISFSITTCSVITPMCLSRMRPLESMRKVSGAPYTPQSMATSPSASKPMRPYGLPSRRSQAMAASRSSFQLSPYMGTPYGGCAAQAISTPCSSWQPGHQVPNTFSRLIRPRSASCVKVLSGSCSSGSANSGTERPMCGDRTSPGLRNSP